MSCFRFDYIELWRLYFTTLLHMMKTGQTLIGPMMLSPYFDNPLALTRREHCPMYLEWMECICPQPSRKRSPQGINSLEMPTVSPSINSDHIEPLLPHTCERNLYIIHYKPYFAAFSSSRDARVSIPGPPRLQSSRLYLHGC